MIRLFINKYLLGGMAIAIFSLSVFCFYQKQEIRILGSQKELLVKENNELTLVNEENLKTIKSFQEDALFNEKLMFEQSQKLSELSTRTCSTVVKIKELSKSNKPVEKSKDETSERSDSCTVDSDIPSELNSLFNEAGY
jgi:predicted membrane protein